MTRLRALFALVLLPALAGCMAWARQDLGAALAADPGRPLVVYTQRGRHEVHAVVLAPDSIRVVPRDRPAGCLECAYWLRVSEIDSVQVRRHAPMTTMLLGGVGLPLLVLGLLYWGFSNMPA